ncbi:hypothetical protein BS78_05G090400 [Paspalum vaginatum]|nr:hypothetical protein BS78_05G090400 [Paspalum vaginatum]
MDRPQQQHVQLTHNPSRSRRGSSADATPPPPTATQPSDSARSPPITRMCCPLYRCVRGGRTEEVMEQLLQQRRHDDAADFESGGGDRHECSILEVTAEKNTVLHVAAGQGHAELIRKLYSRFREQGLLSRQNSALDTPLHCAARAGHVRAVTVLVQLAQDCGESILGCKNEAGDTALHLAARHGHGDTVEILVSSAAAAAAELNNAGVSPLYLAVMSGSVQAVRAIITTCSDASSVGPSSQNALHAAVFQSSEMVNLLLEWRPTLADQVDSSGSSPLHFASSYGGLTIVSAILGAAPRGTVYMKDSGGLSALHVAARMGHARVVEDMVKMFPDAAEILDGGGGTFLHAAAKEKRSSVVWVAIKNPWLRGLLDAQDRDGNTPLHLAVAAGAHGVVEALLRKGKVRTHVLNNGGHTAFDLVARSTSFVTMVRLVVTLVAYGARLRPQRQDQLKQWEGSSIAQGIEKTSDSLAVVAVLIATAAFTAGFNMPGGYNNDGEANLADKLAFKRFIVLDALAVVMSVVTVLLLVYGKLKASRSAIGSWMSFAWALQCMWVSLVCLMAAFYAALVATTTTRALKILVLVIMYPLIYGLQVVIALWMGPKTMSITIWRFLLRQRDYRKGKHVGIQRQYPLTGPSVLHFCLFTVVSSLVYLAFQVFFTILRRRLDMSPAPPPLH